MLLSAQTWLFFRSILLSEPRSSLFAWSEEKASFRGLQRRNSSSVNTMCNFRHLVVLLSVKNQPDCGVTRNETNENKHEKTNGVSNSFYWILCDLWPITCALWPVSCNLCPVSCNLCPVTCDLWPVTCNLWPVTCVLYLPLHHCWIAQYMHSFVDPHYNAFTVCNIHFDIT